MMMNTNDDAMATAADSASPERQSDEQMHMTSSPGPEEEEVEVSLLQPSALIPSKNGTDNNRPIFKSYDCPACEATNMSGQKLRGHFREKHKDDMAAAIHQDQEIRMARGAPQDVSMIPTNYNDSTDNKSSGTWSDIECQRFEAGCIIFGWGEWLPISNIISTRDRQQVKSHAQKFMIHRPNEYQELVAYHRDGDQEAFPLDLNSDNTSSSKSSNISASNDNDSAGSNKNKYNVAGNTGHASWTTEEKEQFKMGVIINGWGQWREVAKNVPTKTCQQVRSRALNIQRFRQDEEARLKAEHAGLVSRNPQLFSSDHGRRITAKLTAAGTSVVAAAAVEPNTSKESVNRDQDSVYSDNVYGEGTWSSAEHQQFEQGVIQYGWGDWVAVTSLIPTRDKNQIKSHAQKFEMHHPDGKERLEEEHMKMIRKKVDERKKMMEVEDGTEAVGLEEERIDVDMMEVDDMDEKNEDEEQSKGGRATDEEEDEKEDDDDEKTSISRSSDESPQVQQLRVSPRIVKAPRDNYIDSLKKDQWQRKKVSKYRYPKGQAPSDSVASVGGVRKRNDSYEVRIWYAGRWCQFGMFESEELAQVAYSIARGILKPENTPTDSDSVEWNIKIARDAAYDGVKLAARDAEEGKEGGVGLLEPPKATQNYLLGGHMVSAGEQTIKHRLFSTATATKTSTNLAHFTVTCTNGPIHVDVAINDSLFDLRHKIFDQFDSSQLDDGNCNFNFQVDTNMISRKIEGSYIARDLIQLGKSVELIPRSAVLAGESSQEATLESAVTNYDDVDDDEEEEEDLTTFYEAAGSSVASKLMNLANEVATITTPLTPAKAECNKDRQPEQVVNFLKETSASNFDYTQFAQLGFIYMMEKTGLYDKQVEDWICDAKKRVMAPFQATQLEN